MAQIPIKTRQTLGNLSRFILDTVLPPRCVITGEQVDEQGMISPQSWAQIDFINDPMCQKCGVPFGYEIAGVDTQEGMHCPSCLDYPPAFATARAALIYNDCSRDLILGFKHADQTHMARAFVPWLKTAGKEMLEDANAIIPVPLHRWRLLKRRYNQAALMADYLVKRGGLNTPVLSQALLRVRATPTQGHLSFKDRRKNVRKAFIVNEKYKDQIEGKTVVLIDDVYTTGATVEECTKVLLKAGAKEVHVLTLARVVKYDL